MLIIESSLAPCQMSHSPSQAEPWHTLFSSGEEVGDSECRHKGGDKATMYSSRFCKSMGNRDGKASARWQLPAAQGGVLGLAVPACAYQGIWGKHPLLCPLHRFQCPAFSLPVWMGAGKLKTILMVAPVGCLSCARAWGNPQWVRHTAAVGAVGARAVCAARARDLGVSVLAVTLGDIRAVVTWGLPWVSACLAKDELYLLASPAPEVQLGWRLTCLGMFVFSLCLLLIW